MRWKNTTISPTSGGFEKILDLLVKGISSPYAFLFTNTKSPTSRLGFIELDGICHGSYTYPRKIKLKKYSKTNLWIL